LNQMGLNTRRLTYPRRPRIERDFGEVMHGILA